MHDFIIFTIGGLATASIYAITASGLTLTYATTGIFNWSHGAIGMLAAFAYWQMHVDWGWNTLLSLAICLFVLAPLLGVVLEKGVMRRLEGTSEAAKLVVTLALALSMVGLAQWVWNPQTYRALPPLFAGKTLVVGAIRISYNDVVVLAVALAVAIGLRFLLYRTRIGVTMRASVDDRTLTTLNGASSIRTAQSAWIVGCILAALAGILVAPTVTLSATALTLLIVAAYAASVIGRLRSIPMTFLGAVILGLAVSYSVAYLPANPYVQGFEGAVPAVVLFVALLLLPQSRLRGHHLLRSRELALVPTWRGTGIFAVGVVVFSVMVASVISQSDLYSLNRVWGLAIVGLSFVPVVGYAGRLSLCQMTFAGIGAMVVGHLGGNPLSLLAAAGICAVAGVLVALPALRLSGIYFALSTAAFAAAMDAWFFPLPAFDLFGHQFAPFGSGSLSFESFRIGGVVLSNKEAQFVVGSVVFVLFVALVVLVRRSEFGSRLFAFKDSPVACATLGMNTRLLPIAVFAFSAAIAGIGGALYGQALGRRGAGHLSVPHGSLAPVDHGGCRHRVARGWRRRRVLPRWSDLGQLFPLPHAAPDRHCRGHRRGRRHVSQRPHSLGPQAGVELGGAPPFTPRRVDPVGSRALVPSARWRDRQLGVRVVPDRRRRTRQRRALRYRSPTRPSTRRLRDAGAGLFCADRVIVSPCSRPRGPNGGRRRGSVH